MKLKGILAENGLHAFDAESRLKNGHQLPRIWILATDRLNGHVYRKTLQGLELIASISCKHAAGEPAHGGGGGHHPDHDPQHIEQHGGDMAFVRSLSDWLDGVVREDVLDRLVVVAPPALLGKLRVNFSKDVGARVAAEVAKDLMQLKEGDIRAHLKDIVWL